MTRNQIPSRLLRQVANILVKGLRDKVYYYQGKGHLELESSLRTLCNIVRRHAELEETTNWGYYFLIEDYESAFQRFSIKPLSHFLEAISEIALQYLEGSVVKDLNQAFAENNFPYRLQNNPVAPWIGPLPTGNNFKEKTN
ncbi:MAG: hypothetical protein GX207_04310 [Peptococcaceae bacterium]|nr:hypothetical protein [Peptococcaceae bacterium]